MNTWVSIDAVGDRDTLSPRRLDQLVATEHTTGILQEDIEQPQFLGRDVDRLAAAPQFRTLEIDLAVAEAVGRAASASAAAQLRANARAQLAQAEWLGDVVVGAGVEAQLLFRFLRPRGQENDRCQRRPPCAVPAHTSNPSIFGSMTSSRITSHALRLSKLEAANTVGRHVGFVTLPAKVLLQAQRDVRFVFDDQNPGHDVNGPRGRVRDFGISDGILALGSVRGTAGSRGRTMVNVLPAPSSDSSSMAPPWAVTMWDTMASPSPVPLMPSRLTRSPRTNR